MYAEAYALPSIVALAHLRPAAGELCVRAGLRVAWRGKPRRPGHPPPRRSATQRHLIAVRILVWTYHGIMPSEPRVAATRFEVSGGRRARPLALAVGFVGARGDACAAVCRVSGPRETASRRAERPHWVARRLEGWKVCV